MPSGRKRSSTQMTKRKRRVKKRRTLPKRRRSSFAKTFPKSMAVQMTYCDEITVPNRDAGSAPYTFRLNSIFDPDFTGTGHQPRGHDQYATIYQKYCVVGAKVLVEPLWGAGGVATETSLLGYMDDDLLDAGYSVKDLVELGLMGGKYKQIVIGPGTANQSLSNNRSHNLRFFYDPKKFFGLSKKTQIINAVGIGQGEASDLEGVQNVGAPFGVNATKPAYLKLHCAGPAHDSGNPTMKVRVTIKYSVIVHTPLEVGSS